VKGSPPIHRALDLAQSVLLEVVGLSRFELLTPRLSSVCSNQLSYRPAQAQAFQRKPRHFKEPPPIHTGAGSLKTR
jgi:hypothetical protein